MAEKTDPNLNINRPPASSTGSNSNAPFTPRSTTFPDLDGPDSDLEFDVFDPTPIHSPGGPRYDDLPPSYDEAQQQARSGIAALDPDDLEVHRMVLSDQHQLPPGQTPQPGHLLSSPHAYEFEPENRRNADGLGMSVPVQHVSTSEQVPVGRVSHGTASTVDLSSNLLQGALRFTQHEPDADVQYAPRLTQTVAIPQENLPPRGQTHHRDPSRQRGCGRRGGGGRGPEIGRIPGQWPAQTSEESLGTSTDEGTQSVQFLRAYAKSLHAHSIRPAEFADFLDGLNVLCDASNTSSFDLLHKGPYTDNQASIVYNYVRSANEVFFAPRGLKVSLQSLSELVSSLNMPDSRGERSAALATALDVTRSPARKAQALHPWVAQLETDMPGPSSQALLLKEMGNRFRGGPEHASRTSTAARSSEPEKANLDREDSDPPHSIPDPDATTGRWGTWESNWGHRGRHGPHRGGMGPGRRPWGGRGGWGGPRGRGSFSGNAGPPDMQAFGQHMGMLGENFGRMMGEWGQQFGKQAEQWGQEMGRRAETFGDQVATRASGSYSHAGQRGPPPAASASFGGLDGQETGIHRAESSTSVLTSEALAKNEKKEKEKGKLKKKHQKEVQTEEHDEDEDDNDDASSISSSSSSSSSDSDDDEPDSETLFVQRIWEINQAAETSRAKGKRSAEEIVRERDAAIEKAHSQRTALQVKNEQKRQKRAVKREFSQKKRELRREHVRRKRELKGFGKHKERKAYMKEWRNKRKELKAAKREARREWRAAKWERKGLRREGHGQEWRQGADEMVWVVVENLDIKDFGPGWMMH